MKFNKLTIAFLFVVLYITIACRNDKINDDYKKPNNPSTIKVPTLQKDNQNEWEIDSVYDGFIYLL